MKSNIDMLNGSADRHCVNYFGYETGAEVKLFCCIADDTTHQINISSSVVDKKSILHSFTAQNHNFENFEREIHENFGIKYSDHPWLKPFRKIEDYPFCKAESEELHEVGVGPIHAGIIEPGHFRFICNGEQIMHLEIQLGFQHRGIEQLFLQKNRLIERTTLAENIAGDTVVGHTAAFVKFMGEPLRVCTRLFSGLFAHSGDGTGENSGSHRRFGRQFAGISHISWATRFTAG